MNDVFEDLKLSWKQQVRDIAEVVGKDLTSEQAKKIDEIITEVEQFIYDNQ